MDLIAVGRRLWARKFLVILAGLVSAAAALTTLYSVHDGLRAKRSFSGAGSVQMLVDTHLSSLGSLGLPTTDSALDERAPLFAVYAASASVSDRIARQFGVSPTMLSVTAQTTETSGPAGPVQSQAFNSAPAGASTPYEVTLSASNEIPVVAISTQAPNANAARRLADSTVTGLRAGIASLQRQDQQQPKPTGKNRGAASTSPATTSPATTSPASTSPASTSPASTSPASTPAANGIKKIKPGSLELRTLGAATGGTVIHQPSKSKAVVSGVIVFVILLLVVLAMDLAIRSRRRARVVSAS
jgi:hypothetical protein